MKNTLTALCTAGLLLVLCQPLCSQNTFGFRLGTNLANQKFTQSSVSVTFDRIAGLNLAAMYEIGIQDNLAIQPEISLIQKGFSSEFEDIFGGKTKNVLRVNHLEIPVLVKYKIIVNRLVIYVAAGPSLGYALSGTAKIDNESSKLKGDDWDGYNRFEIGGHLAGGVMLPVSQGVLNVEIRLMPGLSNLNGDETDDTTAFNRGIGIGLGYFLNP